MRDVGLDDLRAGNAPSVRYLDGHLNANVAILYLRLGYREFRVLEGGVGEAMTGLRTD